MVLVNSNPATIMTDPGTADRTYVGPMTPELVEQIIAKVCTGNQMGNQSGNHAWCSLTCGRVSWGGVWGVWH